MQTLLEQIPKGFNLIIDQEKLSEEILNQVLQFKCHMVYWKGTTPVDLEKPECRQTSYVDWNKGNEIREITLPEEGEIYSKRTGPRHFKELKRIALIGFTNKLELWLCQDTATKESFVDSFWYSPYT